MQTHMSLFITDENSDFKDYCEKAQHFARSLELEGKDRREAAKKRQARESASKNQSNSTAPPGKPNFRQLRQPANKRRETHRHWSSELNPYLLGLRQEGSHPEELPWKSEWKRDEGCRLWRRS
jgi:hypothetical protein